MDRFDVIVVGGGAVGTSAMHHLARRGVRRLLLLEKLSGLGRGATGVWGSLVRMFHASLETTLAATRSVPFYMDFERQVGVPFHGNRTGSLYFLKDSMLPGFQRHFAALAESGLEFAIIDARQGKGQFPDYAWYEDDVAVYEPSAGVASPRDTTEAFLESARRRGAEARLDAEVVELSRTGSRVTGVRTRDGTAYSADVVVVCAGVWSNQLLASAGVELATFPKAIQLHRFCHHHRPATHPFLIDLPALTFGHPTRNNSFVGGYLGAEIPEGQPDLEHVNSDVANLAKHRIARRIPWVKSSTLEGGIKAMESYTESGVGIVECAGPYENLVVSSGWSCTGFTLAPVIGERIADLAAPLVRGR